MRNRRDLRSSQILKIRQGLERGEHFDAPIIVNRKDKNVELFEIIDGNHRVEALTQFLEADPKRTIDVWLFMYDSLSPKQCREVFTRYNLGVKQSVNDFVKLHWEDLKFQKWWKLNANAVCKVGYKWGLETIELKVLLGPYFQREESEFGYIKSADTFVNQVKALDETDFKAVRKFATWYVKHFGKPDRDKATYKQIVFFTFAAIYYRHVEAVGEEQLGRLLLKVSQSALIDETVRHGRAGSRDNLKWLHDMVVDQLNGRLPQAKHLPYYLQLYPKDESSKAAATA